MFGAPGSGKGTQGKILQNKKNYLHISTGDLLRKEIFDETEFGKKIEGLLAEGHFASDEDMIVIIDKFLENNKLNFILDGYPRTIEQAKDFIEKFEGKISVIHLIVDEDELKKRLLLRGKIRKRNDDKEEIIIERFRIYEETTKPILDFFKEKKVDVFDIDGKGKIEDVSGRILGKIN